MLDADALVAGVKCRAAYDALSPQGPRRGVVASLSGTGCGTYGAD